MLSGPRLCPGGLTAPAAFTAITLGYLTIFAPPFDGTPKAPALYCLHKKGAASMRVSGYLYIMEQWICALSLLWALGMAAGLSRHSLPRLLITSALCALAALCAAFLPDGRLRLLSLLPITALSPLAAWPGVPRALRGRLMLLCLALSLILSGAMRLLSGIPLPGWALLMTVCGALPPLAGSLRRQDVIRCATVEILHGTGRVSLTALVDTGNLLRDPVTCLPVIVVSRRAVQRLLPLPAPGELPPGMRLISVRTVAGPSLMPVFRPQMIHLLQNGVWRRVHAMVGLSPDGYDGIQALVPASLIDQDEAAAPVPITQGG